MDAARLPFYLGLDIDIFLQDKNEEPLSRDEYFYITNSIGYLQTSQAQYNFVEFLQTLGRAEMISRVRKISQLVSILDKIHA